MKPMRPKQHQDSSIRFLSEASAWNGGSTETEPKNKDKTRFVLDRFRDSGIWFLTTFWHSWNVFDMYWQNKQRLKKEAAVYYSIFGGVAGRDEGKNLSMYSVTPVKNELSLRTSAFERLFHTFVVTKPLKCQLIQPPMTIMGRTLVRLPFSMSVIIEGSVIGLGAGAARA